MSGEDNSLRDLVADVAAAYFSNSHVNPADIPQVIAQIAISLSSVGTVQPDAPAAGDATSERTKATPAQIRKSVTPDALISFEDGKSYKTLKRHLTLKGLTPADYRERWGLPRDYPMTAPSYSARRSELARSLGLGKKGGAPRKKKA
jgi:predicted transcriptional regulator